MAIPQGHRATQGTGCPVTHASPCLPIPRHRAYAWHTGQRVTCERHPRALPLRYALRTTTMDVRERVIARISTRSEGLEPLPAGCTRRADSMIINSLKSSVPRRTRSGPPLHGPPASSPATACPIGLRGKGFLDVGPSIPHRRLLPPPARSLPASMHDVRQHMHVQLPPSSPDPRCGGRAQPCPPPSRGGGGYVIWGGPKARPQVVDMARDFGLKYRQRQDPVSEGIAAVLARAALSVMRLQARRDR